MKYHTQESFDAAMLEIKYAVKTSQERLDHSHPRRNKLLLDYAISLISSFLGMMNELKYKPECSWILQKRYDDLRHELIATRVTLNINLTACINAYYGKRPVEIIEVYNTWRVTHK